MDKTLMVLRAIKVILKLLNVQQVLIVVLGCISTDI